MLIREPELGYNKDNKRVPRAGRMLRARYKWDPVKAAQILAQKRREAKAEDEVMMHSREYWTNLFLGFSGDYMKQTHSDLGLFLYCMLN